VVVIPPPAGELVAVVVVVVVVEVFGLAPAAGLAAGLACASANAGITARAPANSTPAKALPIASFIGTFSSEDQCLTCRYYPGSNPLSASERSNGDCC
jgi:hypothetical protein